MKHHTVIESDGQTVYITAEGTVGWQAKLAWVVAGAFLLLLLAFPFWLQIHIQRGLLLWLVAFRFVAAPAFRHIGTRLREEQVTLTTHTLRYCQRYAFLRGREHILDFQEQPLSTTARALNKAETSLSISWLTELPDREEKVLLYEHLFPMTPAEYEKTTGYMQELFDLEDTGGYELLFSAN